MSDSAFNDNDPSVYKTHILYMLPTDENCNKLIRVLENHPIGEHVFYQDVSKLGSRPPWLDGVPILVDKSTSKAHKGRNIYTYVQEWKTDDFLPAGSCTGGYASFETNGEDELGDASTKKFASLSTSGVFDLEEGDSAAAATKSQQASSAASGGGGGGGGGGARNQRKEQLMNEAQSKAQALMDARNMQDQRLKARVPAGGGGAKSPYQQPASPPPPQQPPQQQQQQYRQPPSQYQQQSQPPQYYYQQQQQQPRPPPQQYQQPPQQYQQPPQQYQQPPQQQYQQPPRQYQQPPQQQYQQPPQQQYQQPPPQQYQQPPRQYQQPPQQYQQPSSSPQYQQQHAPVSSAYHY